VQSPLLLGFTQAHRDQLVAAMCRRVRGLQRADAEDAVSEALVRFHRVGGRNANGAPIRAPLRWLATAARNRLHDVRRQRAGVLEGNAASLDDAVPAAWGERAHATTVVGDIVRADEWLPDLLARLDRPAVLAAIREALTTVSEPNRRAWWLRVRHDLPHAEVARRLGITVGASKMRVHHANRALRQALRHHPALEDAA
jgi:RNA polymerase sigma factor (sigma-70 family)